jgi:prepilin-type N-terminal cleavage/methylation domain-containing protein
MRCGPNITRSALSPNSGLWRALTGDWKLRSAVLEGFSLIELMVVVGIMGIILTIAVPGVYRYMHPNPLQKAVDDLREACKAARELAVLRTTTTVLNIDLKSKTVNVSSTPTAARPAIPGSIDEFSMPSRPAEVSQSGSFRISDKVTIEGVGINGLDFTDDEHAEVRFYPKGTSDEFSIVLLNTQNGDRRNVWLDAVTGYADFEVNPQRFRVR